MFEANNKGPIGVFDSGYGGLTILDGIRRHMPNYDYVYLGDNARAPYGTRSFDVVYEFTHQAVRRLFELGCPLIIIGCNTASAKALRTIQQRHLPVEAPDRRVLGVIRPTVEMVGKLTKNQHVGVFATEGTIKSESYQLEMQKLYPDVIVTGQACPLWVPIVENGEYDKPGADYFVREYINQLLDKDPEIDTIVLGCTHFPLLYGKIRQYTPDHINLISQGQYIAESLEDYLRRHPEMECRITQNATCRFFTTEATQKFSENASAFLKENIEAERIVLP